MLQLDFRSRRPVYEQLVEKIKELIVHNVLKNDEQLPSVRELAQELTVNPNTIQKAYRELEYLGYIYSIPGKGSFVKPTGQIENNRRTEELKEIFKKVVAELIYFGVSIEELQEIIKNSGKGGGGA